MELLAVCYRVVIKTLHKQQETTLPAHPIAGYRLILFTIHHSPLTISPLVKS